MIKINELQDISKRFYNRLKFYSNEDGIVSGRTITELGFKEKEYLKSVRQLKEQGYIEVLCNRGKRKTNVYKIIK